MGRWKEQEPAFEAMPEREQRIRTYTARRVRLENSIPGDSRPWEIRAQVRRKLGSGASRAAIAEAEMAALGLEAEYLAALKKVGY